MLESVVSRNNLLDTIYQAIDHVILHVDLCSETTEEK